MVSVCFGLVSFPVACGLRLMDNGLMPCAPPCSLFVGISASVHMRSDFRLLGDTTRGCVRLSNLILSNFVTRPFFSISFFFVRNISYSDQCLGAWAKHEIESVVILATVRWCFWC